MMDEQTAVYALKAADRILTPALLIYPELVDTNIRATLRLTGGDPDRWRPHIKTAKIGYVIRQMISHGIRNFKCSTTLELLTACEAGATDVLLAFPVTGANARRTVDLALQFPNTRVSVLVESLEQAAAWANTGVGVFIDVNPGMNRTGIGQDRANDIRALALHLGAAFRGLHYYDGHISAAGVSKDGTTAHAGYDRLLEIAKALSLAGCAPGEIITSGTPAAPHALSHPGLRAGPFRHQISPGTVVYNDMTSLEQLPGLGYVAAAVVLSTVISHPAPNMFTCDAGHKSVSADAGVPTCRVVGRPDLKASKPSEEHLPIEVSASGLLPAIGSHLYLIPRHVCPTVNNFDEAVIVIGGEIQGVERVTARGHESPLIAAHDQVSR
jgi:D-serine deaminase-like pyridoxal phosphate-dependent protein